MIAPVVAWMAAPGANRKEFCPSCGVKRQQLHEFGNSTVVAATQAGAQLGRVEVQQGWEVVTPVSIDCKNCGAGRRYDDIRFVSRSLAPTAGEAVIHARRLQGD